MRTLNRAVVLVALTCGVVLSRPYVEGLALGPWEVRDGVYRAAAPSRVLYYLTDQPRIAGEGTVEATVTVARRTVNGGWGAAALLISTDPQSFWTLTLVEGPDGVRYTELIELYNGIHQAQTAGPTRLALVEGAYGGTWEYGRSYRLRLSLTRDRIVGEVAEVGKAAPLARHGWLLSGSLALRSGWAALREEQCEAEFRDVAVSAPQSVAPGASARSYSQGRNGSVGLYLGEDLPGAERPPELGGLTSRLEGAGFGVARLSSAELSAPGALSYPGLRYLVADLRRMPAVALGPLLQWIQEGGVLVSVAAPALGGFLWRSGGTWLTWDEHSQHGLEALGNDGREIVRWSTEETGRWTQVASSPAAGPPVLSVREGSAPNGQPGLEVVLPHFTAGWWAVGRQFERPPAAEGERLTCFWAKGDAKTPELSVEWTEEDNSRWIAVISLEASWRYYVLPPQAFTYWPDNPSKGRGGPGDQLHLEHAIALHFGISGSHTPSVLAADARENRVALSPIGLAKASPQALSDLAPVTRPEIEALSPGYKLHEIKDAAGWEPTDLGRLWGLPGKLPAPSALGAVERPGGEGFDRGRWWRWVPLVHARDAAGRNLGAPMSLLLSEMLPMPRSAWVNLGLRSSADLAQAGIQEAVVAAIRRLASGPVLFEAGATHFLLRPEETVAAGARIVNLSSTEQAADVRFSVTRLDTGRPIAETASTTTTPPRGLSVVRTTLKPLAEGDYHLTVELRQAGQGIDRITQPLTVKPRLATPPPAAEVVRRDGGRLLLDGRPWHPVGCNYWPHTLGGVPGGAYWLGWLDPLLYDPKVAEADLGQMERWGFRAIAGVGADVGWAPSDDNPTVRNLQDFLWRCQRHHIKVIFFCRGLDPRGRDDEVARALIRAVRYHPALAGYDIAWEPGYWGARGQYAAQWRAWLTEQYGSVEAAEKALAYELPRTEKGEVEVPPDVWFEKNGPWDAAAAAYRAFWSRQLGAEYRRSAAIVRSLDPLHLVGFRGSNVTSPLNFKPVEQPGVLHFMDWAGPEGYDVPAYGRLTDWPSVSNRGLCTRLLSFLSGRKPVVWMEFGMPVYPNGTTWRDEMIRITPERYAYQAEEGRRWWQMQVSSGAWGSFVWWYPGGFRVGENSDCGLVDPNNVPRPIADTARSFMPRFAASESYAPNSWLELKPEANPGGWVGEYVRLRDEYARLVEQGRRVDVRTAGVAMSSADCPLIDPAGRPWPGMGPLRYLDAMFERVRLRAGDGPWQEVELPTAPGAAAEVRLPPGQPVDVEAWAGNLAEAEWLPDGSAGAAQLSITGDAKGSAALDQAAPFQGSGHFAAIRITDRLAGALKLRFQVEAANRAAFGEVLPLTVAPTQ